MDNKFRWRLIDDPRGFVPIRKKKPKHSVIKNFSELSEDQKNNLLQLKNFIQSKVNDCEVYLYGSRVRGKWDNMSDYDIMIVTDNIPNEKIIKEIQNYNYDIKVDISFTKKNILLDKSIKISL